MGHITCMEEEHGKPGNSGSQLATNTTHCLGTGTGSFGKLGLVAASTTTTTVSGPGMISRTKIVTSVLQGALPLLLNLQS